MFKIVATEDFVSMLKDLPIKYMALLTSSFISIERTLDEEVSTDNTFVIDLLRQISDQELDRR